MKTKIQLSKLLVFSVLLSAFILTSCGDKPYFDKSYSFEGKNWEQRVKPKFVVQIDDTSRFYDFELTLRTTTDYSYSNLFIFLNSKTPNGLKAREPFQFRIADPDGKWMGKKSGTVVENVLVFKKRKFPLKGKYTFTIEQGITEQSVNEVLDIGLRMTETK